MIVVDVNVVAYTLIEGERTADAKRLRSLDADWRIPRLWRYEFGNLLATYVRTGGLSEPKARDLLREALAFYGPVERDPDQDAVLVSARRFHITGDDAQYVELARQLTLPLVTEDASLRRAVPDTALSLSAYLTLIESGHA